MAGRGWGKTRTGAETVREWSEAFPRIALVAPTIPDAREIMVDGASGVIRVFPPDRPAIYQPSRRRVEFPSGSIATIYTADEPDRLRGPEHFKAWADEVASWRYPEAWDMLMLGLRQGHSPQVVATTTPKPTPLVKQLRDRSRLDDSPGGRVVLTTGTSYENRDNLSPQFLAEVIQRYEGTRLGRQEIYAEVLDDIEGALWTQSMIDPFRVREHDAPDMRRIVVGIDPAVTSSDRSDPTGLCVAGVGVDGQYYVFDAEQVVLSPRAWGERAIRAYDEHFADAIVPETNQGGDMVRDTIMAAAYPRHDVRIIPVHAKRGKVLRAEPIVALYEQGRVHHVGQFPDAEDQMTSFPVANEHDDMVDALVYALTELSGPTEVWTAG